MDLAELFPRHAFVDLETTGLDPSRDQVIELGVLFVERGVVTQRVSQLFSAGGPLPLAIQRITGICDEDLTGAPPFADHIPTLQASLEGFTVVAHNAGFEQGFLGELLQAIRAPVLDSMELLHYLYPELPSHSLDSAIKWSAVGDRAKHRALQDCEDTFSVLRFALDRFVQDRRLADVKDLLQCLELGSATDAAEQQELATLQPPTPLVELLRALRRQCPAAERPASRTPLRPPPERLRRTPLPPRPLEEPEDENLVPVPSAALDALLGPGGALERTQPGFRSRPAQLQMARALSQTLVDGGTLAVEAATGTGKSLAYLAPSVLFATLNQRRVAVAPHTKTLQDQLIEKDLPRLHEATGGAFSYAIIKGQTNYACRRRMLEATAVEPDMGHAERAPRAYLRAFLRRSAEGDLDRLSYWFRGKFPQLGSLTDAGRSEAATTLGDRCPHFSRCFYHSAVGAAKDADVIVMNQSLALAWPARYPEFSHLVVDEAHELEDVISTALAGELSGLAIAGIRERLEGQRGRRGALAELGRALLPTGGDAVHNHIERAMGYSRHLERDAQAIGLAVQALCASAGDETSSYARELRITEETRESPLWAHVQSALLELVEDLEALAKLVGSPPEGLDPALHPAASRELAGANVQITELVTLVRELSGEPFDGRCYFAVERPGRWQLVSAPVDAGRHFSEALASGMRSLVLTSATLSTGPKRPWVLDRLGLGPQPDRPAPPLLQAATPFDLRSQALVVLVTDAPDPNDEAFLEWSAARITGLAQFLGGRVLGLFASSRRLNEVGERVRARLEPMGIEVLHQSKGHGRSLVARQEEDAGSVLLGTKSFWQGVDVRGHGVACVFIDKLPIEPHSRPLVEAREERIEASTGRNGFMHYRLPKALILLRQGVGRLIRSTGDRGVVIIADPGSATYRREVLAALQGYRVEILPWAQARKRLFHALRAMELHAGAKTGDRHLFPSVA